MGKFKKEKYITQIQNKNGWSFRVRYKGTDQIFNESDFLSASQAFKSAVAYRNKIVIAPVMKSGLTVRQIFDELETLFVFRSETKRKYDVVFNRYISHKDTPIEKITRADIIGDLNAMVYDCSQDVIKRALTVWRRIFQVAIAKDYVVKDVSASISPPVSHKIKPNKTLQITDEQSIDLVINNAKKYIKSPHIRNEVEYVLYTLLYTGMRPAEIFALDKCDVDLNARTISITKEVGSDRDKKNVIRTVKTEMSTRIIPISDKCFPYILKAMKLYKSPVLFPNQQGEHWSTKDFSVLLHLHAKKDGIDFHLYQCRHTFITRLFMQGVDIKTIQELCGQNIDATTLGYVVSDEQRRIRAINMV